MDDLAVLLVGGGALLPGDVLALLRVHRVALLHVVTPEEWHSDCNIISLYEALLLLGNVLACLPVVV